MPEITPTDDDLDRWQSLVDQRERAQTLKECRIANLWLVEVVCTAFPALIDEVRRLRAWQAEFVGDCVMVGPEHVAAKMQKLMAEAKGWEANAREIAGFQAETCLKMANLADENEKLRVDSENYRGKCAICAVANCDMLTDFVCIACERDRLKADNERLRALLAPFAAKVDGNEGESDNLPLTLYFGCGALRDEPTLGDCRRASEALKGK